MKPSTPIISDNGSHIIDGLGNIYSKSDLGTPVGRMTFGTAKPTESSPQFSSGKPAHFQLTHDERATLASIADVATQDEAHCIRVIERLTGEKIIQRDRIDDLSSTSPTVVHVKEEDE